MMALRRPGRGEYLVEELPGSVLVAPNGRGSQAIAPAGVGVRELGNVQQLFVQRSLVRHVSGKRPFIECGHNLRREGGNANAISRILLRAVDRVWRSSE